MVDLQGRGQTDGTLVSRTRCPTRVHACGLERRSGNATNTAPDARILSPRRIFKTRVHKWHIIAGYQANRTVVGSRHRDSYCTRPGTPVSGRNISSSATTGNVRPVAAYGFGWPMRFLHTETGRRFLEAALGTKPRPARLTMSGFPRQAGDPSPSPGGTGPSLACRVQEPIDAVAALPLAKMGNRATRHR